TEIYTLSLHDALPILLAHDPCESDAWFDLDRGHEHQRGRVDGPPAGPAGELDPIELAACCRDRFRRRGLCTPSTLLVLGEPGESPLEALMQAPRCCWSARGAPDIDDGFHRPSFSWV